MKSLIPKKKYNNSSKGFSNFGFSTILLAFAMICIVTFAALALVTANSDYLLSKKVEEKTVAYYNTDIEIFNIIADIDSKLLEFYQVSDSSTDYYSRVQEYFSSDDIAELSINHGDVYTLSFTKSLSEKQYIQIILNVNYPQASTDNFYTIRSWETITDTTVEDDMLNLIGS